LKIKFFSMEALWDRIGHASRLRRERGWLLASGNMVIEG
jgi:hypothetical protein